MSKPSVHLIQLSPQLLVPRTREDCEALSTMGFTSTRIPATSLGLLKTTLLRGVNLKIEEWASTEESLFDEFSRALLTLPNTRVKQTSANTVLLLHSLGDPDDLDLSTPSSSNAAATLKAFNEDLEAKCAHMRKYLGQYCHTLLVQSKDRPDLNGRMYMFSAKLNESLSNTMYYSLQFSTPTVTHFNLGSSYRLKLELDTLVEKPILRVTGEDKLVGGEWTPGLLRTFHINQIHPDNVIEVVNFLLSHLTQRSR